MQDSFSESPESEGLEAVKGFVSVAMRWFTTTLSIGLVIGIVFWSYRLGVRDASELPVIRALNEPARTRPEDPGGVVATNQGLEVNEVLAGEEASIPSGSRTAPPPVALTDEDQPPEPVDLPKGNDPVVVFDPFNNSPGDENSGEPPQETPGIIIISPTEDQTDPQDTEQAARDREQAEREEAARLAREQAEQEEAARLAREQAERDAAERAAREQAARQQEEQNREAAEVARREEEAREIQEALERALREQQEAVQTTPQPAAPNPNVRVQLGTFDSEIGALGHLHELTSVHGDLLASRRISVQKVTAGNRVEFRIRASGFRGEDETAALCQALRARGVDCVQIGG